MNKIQKMLSLFAGREHKLEKPIFISMIWCLGLSLFWVLFLWGFWNKGIYALGMNAFVFVIFTLTLFVWKLKTTNLYSVKDLYWIIPLAILPFSYLIYNNPFIKVVNILVYPLALALFINYGSLKGKEESNWGAGFLFHLIIRLFSIFTKISEAFNLYFKSWSRKNDKGRQIAGRIILGIVLFLIIALTFIIPLLASADQVFAGKMDVIYDWINNFISVTLIYKILFFVFLSIALLSALLAWSIPHEQKEKEGSDKKIDPIIAGIVLGGILALYLLFLWVQVARLWVGNLPIDFKETEGLVKSGFWQLLFLSVVNILIYFFTYRKTNKPVQGILTAFTGASLLLLVSAGQRMFLYVTYYGMSYEKFFASYTVLYCLILFIWLIAMMFIQKRANIFKFLVYLFIWMYALVAVMPVEQIILRSNVALAKLPDSRIRLYELTMLSPDVLPLVKKYQSEVVLYEKYSYVSEDGTTVEKEYDWSPWIKDQEELIAGKKWYEKGILDFVK